MKSTDNILNQFYYRLTRVTDKVNIVYEYVISGNIVNNVNMV